MKRIFNISKFVYDNIGFQNCNTDKLYKPFFYCIKKDINNGMLIYNNLTCELLYMDFDEYNKIYINHKDEFSEERKYLIKHWFLIPNDCNDSTIIYTFKQISQKTKYQKINKIFSYTILTTTNCNARCHYCYELNYTKNNMTEQTALDVVKYIERTKREKVFLHWFGGEPLYNGKIIDLICKSLNERGILFSSTMISNGYLFDKYDINTIKNIWKLQQVQITLDGLENTYNNTKKYIYNNSVNPFYKVIDNIKLLLENRIKVNIRLNLSLDNIDEMYILVDFLYERFKNYNNFSVYSNLLFQYLDNHLDEQNKELYKQYTKLQNYILEHKLKFAHNLQNTNVCHCMADNRQSVVITPNGNLTVCEHYIDDEIIGNIYDSELNQNLIETWSEQYYSDMCNECKLYPKCTFLKKCPSMKCTKEYKNYTEEEIKKSMVISYQNYLRNQNKQIKKIKKVERK